MLNISQKNYIHELPRTLCSIFGRTTIFILTLSIPVDKQHSLVDVLKQD